MPAAFDLMAAAFDSIAAVFDPNTAALNQMPQNKFIPQYLLFALHRPCMPPAQMPWGPPRSLWGHGGWVVGS